GRGGGGWREGRAGRHGEQPDAESAVGDSVAGLDGGNVGAPARQHEPVDEEENRHGPSSVDRRTERLTNVSRGMLLGRGRYHPDDAPAILARSCGCSLDSRPTLGGIKCGAHVRWASWKTLAPRETRPSTGCGARR